jgi:hypothetical protein
LVRKAEEALLHHALAAVDTTQEKNALEGGDLQESLVEDNRRLRGLVAADDDAVE